MDVVAIGGRQRGRNSNEVAEQAQHLDVVSSHSRVGIECSGYLIVGRVVGDEEAKIRIPQDSSDADQSSSSTRHNAHIFPGVLTFLALAIVVVIEIGNCCTERLDTSGRSILAGIVVQRNAVGTREALEDEVSSRESVCC